LAASAWLSVSANQFLGKVDEAGPRPFGRERVVGDAVDLQLGCVRVGEAVADMAVGVNLPVAAGLGQLLAERDDRLGRNHRVVPAVEAHDLRLDLLRRKAGRIEQAVEADRRRDIRAAPREVERALAAEAIAGDDDLPAAHLIEPARDLQHVLEPAAQSRAVLPQPLHLAKHRLARRAAELAAEQVRDQRVVAELDQLPSEADLELGHPHHGRDQDHRRPRLGIATADEHAFELIALELVADGAFLAHDISLASAASFATVFMLRAVPASAGGMRRRDLPIPLSPYATKTSRGPGATRSSSARLRTV
jgi:hypothetical protein